MPTTDAPLALDAVRRRFPALARRVGANEVVFADAPGGTQVPAEVIVAVADYLKNHNANLGGAFATSRETVEIVARARAAAAAFVNAANPDEMVFGANMTSLTFAMSRAITRAWKPGDEVVVSTLDHDANVAPWLLAAEDRGATVRVCKADPTGWTIGARELDAVLSPRTKLVALTLASNATGSLVDLAPLVRRAHAVGALVYVDAVHYAPHDLIDVQALGCDFLACSAYKFFGPHLGLLYGRRDHLESLQAYKVRPSSAQPPGKWETGTQDFAAVAGLGACLGYLGGLGLGIDLGAAADPGERLGRMAIAAGVARIKAHERALSERFLLKAREVPGLRIHGLTHAREAGRRTPTFAVTSTAWTPQQAAERLGEQGICTWAGHFYAIGLIEQLGLSEQGGVLRIGFAHYHTVEEVDRTVAALTRLPG
ncbi:MAG: cysteine desulfurase-like protein [Planctomycetes bacterium]|nr:cysteine desulfurase-like protein [Planctomycetota bacterium]